MNVNKAIREVIDSERFKEDCRTDAGLRVFLSRYRKGTAGRGMILAVLEKYGYKIEVNSRG